MTKRKLRKYEYNDRREDEAKGKVVFTCEAYDTFEADEKFKKETGAEYMKVGDVYRREVFEG
jgi:hypothetical protein